MPDPDFRALCAELHEALEKRCETLEEDRLLDRSAAALRAALAQSEPVVVAPTDEELLASVRHFYGDQTAADMGAEDDLRTARAVLARYYRPTIEPVS
jgi:fructose-1-phosphate kinase PfkB-like protein